jgi:hypothetical protein
MVEVSGLVVLNASYSEPDRKLMSSSFTTGVGCRVGTLTVVRSYFRASYRPTLSTERGQDVHFR